VTPHSLINSTFAVGQPWTGRLKIEVRNPRDWVSGSLDVKVSLDTVHLWFDERSVADLRRDVLREWLNRPGDPLTVDDVTWFRPDGVTCLSIGPTAFFTISADMHNELIALI
jgi:hypothetical protein